MIGFKVTHNGSHLCTAGVDRHGHTTVIVSQTLDDDRDSVEAVSQVHEPNLMVRGADFVERLSFNWGDRALGVGDRVEVEVVETASCDAPDSEPTRFDTGNRGPKGVLIGTEPSPDESDVVLAFDVVEQQEAGSVLWKRICFVTNAKIPVAKLKGMDFSSDELIDFATLVLAQIGSTLLGETA